MHVYILGALESKLSLDSRFRCPLTHHSAALRNKEGSCLFRHEVAYVLGQMQAKAAVSTLSEVLSDATDDPIVRHEVSACTSLTRSGCSGSASRTTMPRLPSYSCAIALLRPACSLARHSAPSQTQPRWSCWSVCPATSGPRSQRRARSPPAACAGCWRTGTRRKSWCVQ